MQTATNAPFAQTAPRTLTQLERHMGWAAVLLQLEVTAAVAYGTLLLPLASRQPMMPALFAVLAAALLFPLGSHLAAGSRRAAIIVAVLFTLRIVETLTAPSFTHFVRMLPLLSFEGFVLLRGIAAALQPAAAEHPDPLAARYPLLRDSVPIIVSLGLLLVMPYSVGASFAVDEPERGFATLHVAGLTAFGIAIALVIMHRLPRRILMLSRGSTAGLSLTVQWPRQAWSDIIIGATTALCSIVIANWYEHMSEWPPLMALLLPLPHAIFGGYIVAALWLAAASGEIHRRPWTQRVRSLAIALTVLFAFMAGPLLLGVLSEVLLELLQI